MKPFSLAETFLVTNNVIALLWSVLIPFYCKSVRGSSKERGWISVWLLCSYTLAYRADQGSSWFSSWWGLSAWIADSCLLTVSSHGGESSGSLSVLIRTLVLSDQGCTLMISNKNHLLKGPISSIVTWGVGASTYEFRKKTTPSFKLPHSLQGGGKRSLLIYSETRQNLP